MLEDLPAEIRAALAAAQEGPKRGLREGPELRLHSGRAVVPVLRLWDGGLALPAESRPHLRGRVDVWDGPRHLFQALIVATGEAGGEVVCAFKRATPAGDGPPRDYAACGPDPEADPLTD
jgi:hypothetical protein